MTTNEIIGFLYVLIASPWNQYVIIKLFIFFLKDDLKEKPIAIGLLVEVFLLSLLILYVPSYDFDNDDGGDDGDDVYYVNEDDGYDVDEHVITFGYPVWWTRDILCRDDSF